MHLQLYLRSWRRVQCYLFCSLLCVSCGKGFNPDEPQQEELNPGRYNVKLHSLNQRFGSYSGWISITISDNQFWVRVKVNGPKTGSMHAQYLHVNANCPSMRDDTNGDGYLDFIEAYAVSGPILIPLDSILTSQMKGLNIFPRMRLSSFYYYSKSCNTSLMMEDLRQIDTYSSDMMTKLKRDEGLNLRRRVVMIYGVNEDRALPSSVRSFEGYPSQYSIPIACGVIEEGESDGFNP